MTESIFQATEPQPDGAARLPLLLVFDVNETLSDMAPLVGRFEEVGAPGRLAGLWFAGLLRDGFALTVSGENPPFAKLAAEGLRMQLSGASIDRDLEEAVDHVMAGPPNCMSTPTCLKVSADSPIWAYVWSPLPTARRPSLNACYRRPALSTASSRSYPWTRRVSGSRRPEPTPMRSSTAVLRLLTRCWSPSILGTPTEPGGLVCRPRGSTESGGRIRRTF